MIHSKLNCRSRFKFFDKIKNKRESTSLVCSRIYAIIRLFLQAPVGVVLKDTIQEYLTPSAPAENAEADPNSATGSSTKEDEEGTELFLQSFSYNYP